MIDVLRSALAGNAWLSTSLERVRADPATIGTLLPAAGRHCGRAELAGGTETGRTASSGTASSGTASSGTESGGMAWRADDAARVLLVAALRLPAESLAEEVRSLYRYGDADEKRGVLRALAFVDVGARCVDLLHDALRTNDTRLVAAAMGPYAGHLDAPAWRQAVLKCVFMGISLSVVDDLEERADAELATMLAGLADERHAAGRAMPDDAAALLRRLTPPHRSTPPHLLTPPHRPDPR
jgi:hypothetical protein